ncbi:MAG TPA: DUF6526 family protein [Vicinamibacterales bacterium]|jgi:hypothetical protein|nr:DUF6526 family protein [Vicinamibacterales bacterium]
MATAQQNFKNHTRIRPAFHFFVLPVLFVNVVITIRGLIQSPSIGTGWGVILAAGLLMLGLMSRAQVVTVQDRVIRLEMRLRLRQILPPDLQARIYELTTGQLIAMRFAGDAELPELTREVLSGNLPTVKAIKQRVKNWQPDLIRA